MPRVLSNFSPCLLDNKKRDHPIISLCFRRRSINGEHSMLFYMESKHWSIYQAPELCAVAVAHNRGGSFFNTPIPYGLDNCLLLGH